MSNVSRRSVLVALGAAAIPPMVVAGARPAVAADDHFASNTALYADPSVVEGTDYARRFRRHAALDNDETLSSPYPDTAIIAPHGGGIETGTSELCLALAGYHPKDLTASGAVYDYWMFEGLRSSGNGELHVTSIHCDDPVALATVAGSRRTVSLHGCKASDAGLTDPEAVAVLVGGADTALKAALISAYRGIGVTAIDAATVSALDGDDPRNIVNRNLRGAGVQLELTTAMRTRMFGTNTRAGRKSTTLESFWSFVNATRQVLAA
ncbi:poly-gamma-glutamate hydrolase family protein [Actinoplanes regularis]|uniref:Phage-related replication protein YjqB, UPF0714/DUF867 family n=1 Tax=Actinoplanes regularis TaxID=52697 RepID=A0A239EV21_9ACTN|nr:poly-gamma-glutamate hydrolase family protein [Actinoplanes regularis]GIE89770.1 hypothetical protein Are01nite_62500 [Actinoplanes regularis]SNS48516.1 Phage-related replication protein YjqB, UPF0714/DUF867 family [Actinoplanes regularis]